MSNLAERTVKTEPIFDGRVIKVRVDDVVLPNGAMSKREIVNHPGAVILLLLLMRGKLCLLSSIVKRLKRRL